MKSDRVFAGVLPIWGCLDIALKMYGIVRKKYLPSQATHFEMPITVKANIVEYSV